MAHITESSVVTLLGLDPTRDPHSVYALAIIYQDGSLRFVLGYANLHTPAESISIERATAAGQIAERLTRLMSVIEPACSAEPGATASAAREAFNWLAWPALALSCGISPRFLDTMRNLNRGMQARFEARIMLPTVHPLAEYKGAGCIRQGAGHHPHDRRDPL